MKKILFVTLLTTLLLEACQGAAGDTAAADRAALQRYMATYPEAHLQDIYKSCFQNVFGVAHLIGDTQACVRYIESEMAYMLGDGTVATSPSSCPFEYTLPDSQYVRVDLHAVADGTVPMELLVRLLMESAATPPPMTQQQWATRWQQLRHAADALDPRPQDYDADVREIDSLLAAGDYVMHHSRHYNAVYHPHYRLVRRDLCEQYLMPQE